MARTKPIDIHEQHDPQHGDDHQDQFQGVHRGGGLFRGAFHGSPINLPSLNSAADHEQDEQSFGPKGRAQLSWHRVHINASGDDVKVNRQEENEQGPDHGFQGGPSGEGRSIPLFHKNFLRHGERSKQPGTPGGIPPT